MIHADGRHLWSGSAKYQKSEKWSFRKEQYFTLLLDEKT